MSPKLSELEEQKWLELEKKRAEIEKLQKVAKQTRSKLDEENIILVKSFREQKKSFLASLSEEQRLSIHAENSNLKKSSKGPSPKTKPLPDSEQVLSALKAISIDNSGDVAELVDIGMNLHCKLSYTELLIYLKRASVVGVTRIILTGSNLENAAIAREVCTRYYTGQDFSNIGVKLYYTVGLHPHEASKAIKGEADDPPNLIVYESFSETMNQLADSPLCVSFGECGLDYDRMLSSRVVQKKVFEVQLNSWICFNEENPENRKPLFVHLREIDSTQTDDKTKFDFSAVSDLEEILSKLPESKRKVLLSEIVVHCFTGNSAFVQRLLNLGVKIGFTGYIGLEKRATSSGTIDAVRIFENHLSLVMIETDAPYMRPDRKLFPVDVFKLIKQNKGGHNEPATLPVTCKVLASLLEKSPLEVATQTTENAKKFFNLERADLQIKSHIQGM